MRLKTSTNRQNISPMSRLRLNDDSSIGRYVLPARPDSVQETLELQAAGKRKKLSKTSSLCLSGTRSSSSV